MQEIHFIITLEEREAVLKKVRKLVNRAFIYSNTYIKVLVVFIAFALMTISSCLIMYNVLSRDLTERAEASISDVQILIEGVLYEPKVVLDFISDILEDMIIRGEDFDTVREKMRQYTSEEFRERIPNFTYHSLHGYFNAFNEYYDAIGWIPPEGYDPQQRPWYLAAVADFGNVIITPVYIDADTKLPVIGYARSMHDNDGNLLGVVAMDVPVSFINQLLSNDMTKHSYNFIVDEQSIVIAHPSDEFIGEFLINSYPGLVQAMYDAIRYNSLDGIIRADFINYTGEKSVLFSSKTFNGWYVNFVVPEAELFRDLYVMLTIVSILGFALALSLSFILVRIDIARSKSELLSQQKSEFLATISHEIRTPMSSIIGFSELALDDNVSPKTKHYLISIADNAKWLLNIINDILDNSKIEAGKVILEKIPFDLKDVISQCQSAILPKAAEKGIELFCYTEPFPGKSPVGDPVRLRQVFMNLLSNSVKFTNAGSVRFMSSIKEIEENYVTVHFKIKDTGIGMTQEQIANVFKPFMQGDSSVTRKFGGTGLGLPIIKSILDLMGGDLKVESAPGKGSIFSFDLTFNLIDNTDAIQPGQVITGNLERPNFNGEVLICEDNGLNQQVIREHLSRVGLTVMIAGNGKEGVEIVKNRIENREKPFDLILMDIHMPVMDGLEAASRINAMGVKTPIITMTANIMSNDLELYKASGMNDYLGKPFTTQDLWKCLLKYFTPVSYTSLAERDQSKEEDQSLKQLQIYFVKNNKDTIDNLLAAINIGDLKFAHRIAHTLKGNAGQIGEKELQEEALLIENILKYEDIPSAKAQIKELKKELDTVLEKLIPLADEAINSKQEKITDPVEIRKILDKLEPMLIKRNPESMNLVNKLNAIPGAEKLALYVEDFEFKKAIEEFQNVRDNIK